MSKYSNSIAIIPARSGSKRVPHKNIREMCGKPLIAYTIEAAIKCGIFSKIIVTTDSTEIADISKKYGAEIPFLRNKQLSDDHCPISLATLDVIEKLLPELSDYSFVAQLMANCPLRDEFDIINSYNQFIETDADAQISVMKYGWFNPWWAMERDSNYVLSPIFNERLNQRSQDLPDLFSPTGAIWWAKIDVLRNEKTFHCKNRKGWEISMQNGIDIDTTDDWNFAEILMQHKQKKYDS